MSHPKWNEVRSLLATISVKNKTLMLIMLQHPERLLSCTVQFQTKARVFLQIIVRAREWEKSGKANEHKERERNKAQRESLSAANTDRVMHQDLVPCLHRSSEWSILCTDTLLFCSEFVC